MSLEKSRGRKSTVNFGHNVKAFDESAVPVSSRAARREVVEARKTDYVSAKKPLWNSTTSTGAKFPDRQNMRVNSVYDSLKRADYNYRAEGLEWKEKLMYIPKATKFQTTQADFVRPDERSAPEVARVPKSTSLAEGKVSAKLDDKVAWNFSTVNETPKERNARIQRQIDAAITNTGRHAPKEYTDPIARETAFMATSRSTKKMERYLRSQGLDVPRAAPKLDPEDELQMSRKVPAKRVTTWSLGSFC